jgi:cytochrome c-type biogenesis protein CcmH
MKYTSKLIIYFLLFVFSNTIILTADELEDRTRKIAHKLRCPTCQAMSVKESEAGLSNNMKMKIRDMLKNGKEEKEILQYFEERYGEWILRAPKKEGFNLLLWIAPGIFIIISGLVLLMTLKKNVKKANPQIKPLSENEKEQIERELTKME